MIRFLYTLAMSVVMVFAWPAAVVISVFNRSLHLADRFSPPRGLAGDGSPRVWIHAASVGESGIARSLAGELKRRYPTSRIFISTVTVTGRAHIEKLSREDASHEVDGVFLAPFDHPLVTGRFFRAVRPDALVLVETELWPWLIGAARAAGVPVTVINGRVSRRAFRRYSLLGKEMRGMLDAVGLFCVQTRTFARRFRRLGVPQDRLEVIGNVKFDNLPERTVFDVGEIRRELGIPETARVFVAGSTRPGEEAVLAEAFRAVRVTLPDACMVLAPRHLNRLDDVRAVLDSAGLGYALRSADQTASLSDSPVLVLDTMGELLRAFACADAAFVGGSLGDFGGHNPLEPAALGIPVLFGPYMEQTGFKELLSGGAASLVHDGAEVADALRELLGPGDRNQRMAAAGPKVVGRFRGTLARTLDCMAVRGFLPKADA